MRGANIPTDASVAEPLLSLTSKIIICLPLLSSWSAVNKPIEIYGKKNATKNLRYKLGKDLNSKGKDVFEVINPSKIGLPDLGISYKYIFTSGSDFLVYPNNFNEFANLYQNSFQHGGISMEEMILPFVFLQN